MSGVRVCVVVHVMIKDFKDSEIDIETGWYCVRQKLGLFFVLRRSTFPETFNNAFILEVVTMAQEATTCPLRIVDSPERETRR